MSFRVFAMTNTEAIQFVNRYYDLLNQYAVVKNDAPGLARQITSMHVENAGSIYPDVEVKLGGLPDTKGVVISTYLTSISDPERKKSMLLKFVPKGITIKSNSGGGTCVSYILYVYDDNATPNSSVLKYSVPLEMRINQYYKINSITKHTNDQNYDDTPKTPNVSKKVQTHNGHEYVDLGLSVMWATCNVGADNPYEYGDYFAWGEITSKNDSYWHNYKFSKGKTDRITKYCTKNRWGNKDNCTRLYLSDDAANSIWGSSWRMPSQKECRELIDNCICSERISVNGYYYFKLTSKKNGAFIIIPAGGQMYKSCAIGRNALYWSSELDIEDSREAYHLIIDYTLERVGAHIMPLYPRYALFLIRPVFSPQ